MLTSAGIVAGFSTFHDKYFFIKRQVAYGLIPGIAAFFLFFHLPYPVLKKIATPYFFFTLFRLLAVFIPGIGSNLGTASRSWIVLWGHSFQPVEFAKLGLIMYMAAFLSAKGKDITSVREGFIPALTVGFLPVALALIQPDVGTAAILFTILFGILFMAEANIWHLASLAGVGVAVFILLIIAAPYRIARFTTFLHPELDPLGKGYQVNQALVAIGSGGFFGLGLGHSRQKFEYLPEVHADSIFAIFGEEMGFVFCALFIVLLLLICYRGLIIAKRAPDPFGRLVVAGIVLWFMVQSFLNIGAAVNILPLTGVPLPFVSHGGTALMVALAAVGIIMNVSRESVRA